MRGMKRTLVAAALALGTLACASTGGAPRAPTQIDGDYWESAEIRESGATTAWDALQRLAFSLHPRDNGGITPVSIGRGDAQSLRNTQLTLVVIDGMKLMDLRVLRDIPASQIRSMQVMSVTRAIVRYGNDGRNGAIVVVTRPGGVR